MNNEQVRAAALEEAEMACNKIAADFGKDEYYAQQIGARRCFRAIHALATTATPERSGKLADEVVGVIVADGPVYGWHMRALKPWDQIGAGTKLYTRAPQADSSSAAPSDECITCDGKAGVCRFPLCKSESEQTVIGIEVAESIFGAAPSPTRESLYVPNEIDPRSTRYPADYIEGFNRCRTEVIAHNKDQA